MAEANKTLITRAEVTSIINAGTKRFALVMDGNTIELGRTGKRDISASLLPGYTVVAGALVVERIGYEVYLTVDVQVIAEGNNAIATPMFASLSPEKTAWTAADEGGTIGVTTGGTIYIQDAAVGAQVRATVPYTTAAAWPGGLPGVPFGDPVVI